MVYGSLAGGEAADGQAVLWASAPSVPIALTKSQEHLVLLTLQGELVHGQQGLKLLFVHMS